MTPPPSPFPSGAAAPDPRRLLADAGWVRGLARSLVGDEHLAEDVVQDALVLAVERPPAGGVRPSWLAGVVRNLALRARRGRARRGVREALAARPDVGTGTDELVERAAMHRAVVDAVMGLAEPYRGAVLLRYLEEVPPREIARRRGLPVDTVRTHLQRGLEQLRRKLDAEYGDRDAWCVGLAALAAVGAPGGKAAAQGSSAAGLGAWLTRIGGWTMTLKIVTAVAVTAVCAVALLTLSQGDTERGAPSLTGATRAAPTETMLAEAPGGTPESEERSARDEAVATGTVSEGAEDSEAPEGPLRSGRVLDAEGRPVGGLVLEWVAEGEVSWDEAGEWLQAGNRASRVTPELRERLLSEPEFLESFVAQFADPAQVSRLIRGEEVGRPSTRTLADGTFELAIGEDDGKLVAGEAGLSLLGPERARGTGEWTYVALPVVPMRVAVTDPEGAPLEGARIGYWLSLQSLPDLPLTLEGYSGRNFGAVTDASGHADHAGVPWLPASRITVSHEDFQHVNVALPRDGSRLSVQLAERKPEKPRLRGRVVDLRGRAVAGAGVFFGQDSTQTDELGHFDLEVTYHQDRHDLVAFVKGRIPGVLEDLGAQFEAKGPGMEDLVVTLGDEALSISGQVVDEDGEELSGWNVEILEGTRDGSAYNWIETRVAGRPMSAPPRTERDGTFDLDGLFDRDYRIKAWNEETGIVVISEPVPAGTQGLVLQVPDDAFCGPVRGVVVDARGNPLADVTVEAGFDVIRFESGSSSRYVANTRTDDAGRFEFARLPRYNVFLATSGAGLQRTRHDLDEGYPDEPQRLAARVECRVRLKVADEAVRRLTFLDAAGERMPVRVEYTTHTTVRLDVVPRDGVFPTCTVPETATVLEVELAGGEVRRETLDLRPREVTVLEL